MKVVLVVPAMFLIVMGSGCGPRNVYEVLRVREEMNCEKPRELIGMSAQKGPG